MGRIALLYLAFAAFAVAYAVLTPPGEAPDELPHLQYVDYLLHERRIPDRRFDHIYQDHHPPLYHGTAAVALGLAQRVHRPERLRLPGPFSIDLPLSAPMLDRAALERGAAAIPPALRAELEAKANLKPRHDRISRLHLVLVRLWSVLLALTTLGLVHATAREVLADRGAVEISLAFAALLPQFAFIGAVVNCDIMAACTGNLVLYLCVRTLVRGTTTRWAVGLGIGIAAGLAMLAKMSGIAVAIPIAATYVLAGRVTGVRPLLASATAAGLATVAVGGWWYGLNYTRYGDPFMVAVQAATMGEQIHQPPLSGAFFAAYFHDTIRSFFGYLGPLRVPIADWALAIYLGIVGLAIAGGLTARDDASARATPPRPGGRAALIVLALGLAATWAVVFRGNLTFYSFQGRYLLPALSAIAIGVGLGLHRALRPGRVARTALIALLFGLAAQLFWGRYLPEDDARRDRAEGPRVVHYEDAGHSTLAPHLALGAPSIAPLGDPRDSLQTVVRGGRIRFDFDRLPLGEPLQVRLRFGESLPNPSLQRITIDSTTVVAATQILGATREIVVPVPGFPTGRDRFSLALDSVLPGGFASVAEVWVERTALKPDGLVVPRDLRRGGAVRAVVRFRNRDDRSPAAGEVGFVLTRDAEHRWIGAAAFEAPAGGDAACETTLEIPADLAPGPVRVAAWWVPAEVAPLLDVSPCQATVYVGRIEVDPLAWGGRWLRAAGDPTPRLEATIALPDLEAGRYRVTLSSDGAPVAVRWRHTEGTAGQGPAPLDVAWPGGGGTLDLQADGEVRIDRVTVTAVGGHPRFRIPVPHESACHLR